MEKQCESRCSHTLPIRARGVVTSTHGFVVPRWLLAMGDLDSLRNAPAFFLCLLACLLACLGPNHSQMYKGTLFVYKGTLFVVLVQYIRTLAIRHTAIIFTGGWLSLAAIAVP
jgi:hypothetical protein